MDFGVSYLLQSPLPAVLPLHHEIDTVRQSGQDAGCGGFERDGLALKVYAIDSFGSQGLEDCTNDANKADKDLKRRLIPSNSLAVFAVSSLHTALIFHDSRFSLLPLPCRNSPSVRVLGKSSSSSSTTERHRRTVSVGLGRQTLQHTILLPRGPD